MGILDEELEQIDTLEYAGCTVPVWKVVDQQCNYFKSGFIRHADLPEDLAKAFNEYQTLAACPGIGTSYLHDFTDFMDRDGRGWSGDFSKVVMKYKGAVRVNDLAKAVSEITPKSIDDIIKLNRDMASLSLLSNDEIVALPSLCTVTGQRPANGQIDGWYVVKMIHKNSELKFVIGYKKGNVFNTSRIDAFETDGDSGVLITANSMYRLGKQGVGEPELGLLLHVCHFLHRL